MKALQTTLFLTHFCVLMVVLGGAIFCVLVEYPNWFANVPSSLETTRAFYNVLHPGYFFQSFGPLTLLSGILFIIVGWRITQARNLVAFSILILIAVELLTFLYIYPRLRILFAPDVMSMPIEVVRLAGDQFTTADRIRTALSFVAGGLSITALFGFFKHKYSMSE